MPELKDYINTREAALLLGITVPSVRRLTAQGKLTRELVGPRQSLYLRADVQRYAAVRLPSGFQPGWKKSAE